MPPSGQRGDAFAWAGSQRPLPRRRWLPKSSSALVISAPLPVTVGHPGLYQSDNAGLETLTGLGLRTDGDTYRVRVWRILRRRKFLDCITTKVKARASTGLGQTAPLGRRLHVEDLFLRFSYGGTLVAVRISKR